MYTQPFSSSGMFDQDDTENWEMQTRVSDAALYREEEVELHYGMGINIPTLDKDEFPGPGDVYDGKYSESAARTYYQVWRERILEVKR